MGAEIGATTSLFPFNNRMSTYLRATGRGGEWVCLSLRGRGRGAWVACLGLHLSISQTCMSGQEKVAFDEEVEDLKCTLVA